MGAAIPAQRRMAGRGTAPHHRAYGRSGDAHPSFGDAYPRRAKPRPALVCWRRRDDRAVRRTVEAVSGGLCLYLQGAAGNQDTIRDASCRPEDARWVGRQIGLEAARVAELIETQPTRTRIGRVVESSWPMGVVERVADGD